jgi:uncharacterized protein YcfJ
MNKGMLMGAIAGLGVAVAGGVVAFSQLNQSAVDEEQTGAQVDTASIDEAQATASTRAQNAAPAQRCWEEEVEVPAEPRDDKAIAGTAAGAVIGGALADRLGDDDDLVTAAGAAAGAFIGRKAQREFQENRTTTTTVTRCEPQ